MRRLQKCKGGKPRKKAEPLAEGIRKERRPSGFFTKMGDEELVRYVQGFMKKKGISGRKELQKADTGLYSALRRRGLLDLVFSSIEQANELARQKEAVQQVVDAMKEFDG